MAAYRPLLAMEGNVNRQLRSALYALLLVLVLGSAGCGRADSATGESATFADPQAEPIELSGGDLVAPNQLIVLLRPDASASAAKQAADAAGGEVVGSIGVAGIHQVALPATDEVGLAAAVEAAEAVDGVELAALHGVAWPRVEVQGTPCSPVADDQMYAGDARLAFENIGLERAWKLVKASGLALNTTKVGVVDHPGTGRSDELARIGLEQPRENVKGRGWFDHGDHAAGIIGADPDNGGMVGIGSYVMGDKLEMTRTGIDWSLTRVADAGASPSATQAADPTLTTDESGTWAVGPLVNIMDQITEGATVINCSWGAETPNPEKLAKVYKRFFETMAAEHPEVVFVCSVPHGGTVDGTNDWPSGMKLPNVVSVGAVGDDGKPASATQSGDGEVTLVAATGVLGNQVTTDEDGQSVVVATRDTATSWMAPQVSAAAAILKGINPSLSAADVKRILVETAATEVILPSGKTATVPGSVGGRALAIDRAVLKVINDRLAKERPGAAPLTLENVTGYSDVALSAASEDGSEWTVSASTPALMGSDTQLALRVEGSQAAVGGSKSQKATAGTPVTWSVSVSGEPVTVHVTRADTGGCSRVKLGGAQIVGTWSYKVLEPYHDGPYPAVKPFRHELVVEQAADGSLSGHVTAHSATRVRKFDVTVAVSGDSVTVTYPGASVLTGRISGDSITGRIDQSAAYDGGTFPVFDRSVGPENFYTKDVSLNGAWKATRQ